MSNTASSSHLIHIVPETLRTILQKLSSVWGSTRHVHALFGQARDSLLDAVIGLWKIPLLALVPGEGGLKRDLVAWGTFCSPNDASKPEKT